MAVIWIAVQRFGVQHKLPAFGGSGGCDDGDLAAELIGSACLAFARANSSGAI
jgi:hypothetical protein